MQRKVHLKSSQNTCSPGIFASVAELQAPKEAGEEASLLPKKYVRQLRTDG